MAKLLKLRRGTTSQHNSFTGAEGEVTIDTTKDTAVVHDGSTAGGTPLAKEDMSNVSSSSIAGRLGADSIAVTKIAAGTLPSDVKVTDSNVSGNLTIVNADVTSSAAIAGTKISPAFGSQNISTTGTTTTSKVTLNSTSPMVEFEESDGNPDYRIISEGGALFFQDADAGPATRIKINSDGHVDVLGNLDVGSGIDVTGNMTVTGTVDGRDVAQDGGKLDELYGGSNQLKSTVHINDGATATTQAQSDNSIKLATTAYVRTAVAGVVDSAPAALDTLNELAAALGDDANFATTTSNSIGTKLPKSGGQMTGNITMSGSQTVDGRDLSVDGAKLDGIESGATADQSASEILTLIKTVDGAGSGLDADTLDGISSGSFVRNNSGAQSIAGNLTVGTGTASYIYMADSDHGSRSIHNNSNQIGFLKQDGNWGAYCDDNGNWTASGNVTAYSDARLKTNVNTINDALSIVGKLRGVSFDWKESGEHSIGVIAQEVEKVLPELVVTSQVLDPTGESEVKSVDYGKIVGVLINAINELKAEVDELKGGK